MKFLIASDIHGSAYWAERLMSAIEEEQPDRVILLGDLLYHGPRNDLPRDYAPKRVIPLLNDLAKSGRVIAVRGNCEAEVDQMVLEFPCMSDSALVMDSDGRELFCTHGHVFGAGMHNSVDNAPVLPAGSALVYGHQGQRGEPEASGLVAFQSRQRIHPQRRDAQLRHLRGRLLPARDSRGSLAKASTRRILLAC